MALPIKMNNYNFDFEETLDITMTQKEVSVYISERSNYVQRKDGNKVKKAEASEPIRSKEDLANFIECLSRSSYNEVLSARNLALFIVGITTGLRVSDILKLRFRDVIKIDRRTKQIEFQDRIHVVEQKTGKTNIIPKISNKCKSALYKYLQLLFSSNCDIDLDDYLWVVGDSKTHFKIAKDNHLNKCNYYDTLQKVGRMMIWQIPTKIGTHTMRKTFGYHMFKQSQNKYETLAVLQEWFNHSSQRMTLKYIGITQDQKQDVFNNFDKFLDDFIPEENDFDF